MYWVFPFGQFSLVGDTATLQFKLKKIMRQKMASIYKTFSGASSLKLFTAVFNISSIWFVTVSKLWRTLIIPNGVQHNDIQHENKRTRLSIMMLNTMTLYIKRCYGECRLCQLSHLFYCCAVCCHAECHYAEFCYAECHGAMVQSRAPLWASIRLGLKRLTLTNTLAYHIVV